MSLEELKLNFEHKDSKKLLDLIRSSAKKLNRDLSNSAKDKEKAAAAIYSYYRKYFTLTLNKTWVEVGINKSPTRDIILDYPWKDLEQDRFFCLKIWEKINH